MEYEDFKKVMESLPDCEVTSGELMSIFHAIMCVYGLNGKDMMVLMLEMVASIAGMDEANILETDSFKAAVAKYEGLH